MKTTYTLNIGCRRGTITSRDSDTSEFATYEAAHNDVPIGRIGKCEVVQLMPKIAEMAAEKFSDVNLLMVSTHQKRIAETLNC